MKLHIAEGYPRDLNIRIADDNHRVVCTVHCGPGAGYLAEQIVERFNTPWWRRLLPRGRDARQKAYDRWIWQRQN